MTAGDLGEVPGHVRWAAQARPDGSLGPGVRAWRHGSAVAVAAPDLSRRDRLAVAGGPDDPDDAVRVVREALARVGAGYRPFGEAALATRIAERVDGFVPGPDFLWMETATPTGAGADAGARWLTAREERAAAALFDAHFPGSYALPGRAGARRWAGVFDGPDVVALAADAWSGYGCGLLAGVLTRPAARGRGLGRAVCGFLVDELVAEYGRAALMVDGDNPAAIAVYEGLGMRAHRFRAVFPTAVPAA